MANSDVGKVKFHARLSYEHLWKKSASIENGAEKYRCTFLIDPSTAQGKKSLAAVENGIEEVIEETWNGKKPKFKEDRYPLMDGDEFTDDDGNVRDGYEGMMYVKGTNDRRPKLRDRDGQTDLEPEDDKIYSGANCLIYGRFYPITEAKKGGNGIFFTIDAVQWVSHGEKFAGGGIDDEEIENLGDDEDDEKPRKKKRTIDDEGDDEPPRKKKRSLDDEI